MRHDKHLREDAPKRVKMNVNTATARDEESINCYDCERSRHRWRESNNEKKRIKYRIKDM